MRFSAIASTFRALLWHSYHCASSTSPSLRFSRCPSMITGARKWEKESGRRLLCSTVPYRLPLVSLRPYFAPAFLDFDAAVVEDHQIRPVSGFEQLNQQQQTLVRDPAVLAEILRMDAGPCGELGGDGSRIVGTETPQGRAAEEIGLSLAGGAGVDGPALQVGTLDGDGLSGSRCVAPADIAFVDGFAAVELHPVTPDPGRFGIGVARRYGPEPGFDRRGLIEPGDCTADRNGPVQDIRPDEEDEQVKQNRLDECPGPRSHIATLILRSQS